ncbi:hypothetical protein BKM31_13645 [[Actinomadura] parvosata subsp. kistnae]|uniref:Uncharacterized protein n=1 Tax=[Actinomadura] parvosata subsp. kistnae TaxID=1909395 RepID=A0A1U9ZWN8_9ACTN|nr:hypothetical protein [Nonomuraea sp. ATCC 55076]AQZ62368.1 hypothetical protein BKM31_13645 [Nonomuraea sp. ATCC 55076]
MDVKWGALGQVFVVSLAVSVAVVVVFSLGVMALSARRSVREHHGDGGSGAVVAATLCFTACAAVVLYGLYLIVPQFH